ncbi:hypothetical protein NZD89_27875 (plasmid) [Alicyclobacillus fastidiosus]|uniref:Uncharacterized protein n=1 Tax=Alicyclobacillus fastidiosus TaxID=392011 RepID=A0ABY6ZQI8_9BACL|nr:hypothetical protein [Alicyclobacillus fastidiosus]WAH44868.1 hypothetical protein NZD89_27875 [Alicyclobacillus fastidiosus]GMA65624.1 hypothetical protein GCM10025859_60640 [Alicyclobacillus fastidiosus]GMA65841.1 hypothetical protein GCM10025859_62810 [Alicyclobacillus fastidiosus]
MSKVLDFYQEPNTPDFEDRLEQHQNPYDNPKFYHAMRVRLESEYDLPTSSIAVMIGLHSICDLNTGEFNRSDSVVRELIGLENKSTYSIGFTRLLEVGLVKQIDDVKYVITHYEQDRCNGEKDKQNYFRITSNFVRILPRVVKHGHKRLMFWALECLDRSRIYNSENVIGMQKLIKDRKLGTCPKRVYQALELMEGFMAYSVIPNSAGDDVLLQFWPVKQEERTEEQVRLRRIHGEVATEIRDSFNFAHGVGQLNWRELSRMARKIIEYGLNHKLYNADKQLDAAVVKRMAGRFGAYCARNKIKKRLAYLGYILKNGHLEDSLSRMPA